VNTKNISLAYLLANYLKFSAPQELMGCKENSGQKFHERKKNKDL